MLSSRRALRPSVNVHRPVRARKPRKVNPRDVERLARWLINVALGMRDQMERRIFAVVINVAW